MLAYLEGRSVTSDAEGLNRVNDNKAEYVKFCETTYVPIFSRAWWMDAVCGEDNWDVWLYEQGGKIMAAMPYYLEVRGKYKYITKAPLTQNNGIVFKHESNAGPLARAKFEEHVIEAACAHIASLGLDVYEQQYHRSFSNWSPFFWHGYDAITRYTYVIEDMSDLNAIEEGISRGYRKNIRKAKKCCSINAGLDEEVFYREHEKIFAKQGLPCPFRRDLWHRLLNAVVANESGEIIWAEAPDGGIASLMFLVWDDEAAYPLLGGTMPQYYPLQSYSLVTWTSFEHASARGLAYDFEGSMIERIAKSFREYGAVPKPYFRVRKVFNPEVIRMEAEGKIERMVG